ncbi:hypothetical protein PMPD1_1934 [Paramixta manurensis]|uniref:DUF943 family protein n=1 Tax=Paramixta manurensis TaxID=2740817 RepID=A0A6M8UBG7_9GAMM|nr:hypothetical protein PMPD1_1934 [Erwiniaceae bacterium PD-1]
MRITKKKLTFTLIVIVALSAIYRISLPAKIISVHQDSIFSDIVVKNFPITDSGKIKWWLDNQSDIENKYHIPHKDDKGRFAITFWSFGDGYKNISQEDIRLSTQTSDLKCFSDIKNGPNCIDKDRIMTVEKGLNGPITITTKKIYTISSSGKVKQEK